MGNVGKVLLSVHVFVFVVYRYVYALVYMYACKNKGLNV